MSLIPLILAAVVQADPGATPPPAVAGWRFVVTPPGDPFEHPPLRVLALGDAKPDDVRELVAYRGGRRRYGQLRYGSPGSVRVTVVLDEVAPGEADVYVDADRNRRIESKDRAQGEGRVWRVPLDVATVDGEVTTLTRRAVVLRLSGSGRTLGVAAAGYLEGTVRLAGRDHAARRADGDGDGSYTGAHDRLWIDRDDDGRWDPVAEQFLYHAIATIGPDRYAVRSDPSGTWLNLEPLEGTGTVRLAIGRAETRAQMAEIHVMLVGRDGSALGLNGLDADVAAPVGEYRVAALTLSLADPDGGPAWHFVFSDTGGRPDRVWHEVRKGQAVVIDPIGALELRADIHEEPAQRKRGEPVTILPKLFTGDGLLINAGHRGPATAPGDDAATTARVSLRSGGGAPLDATTSGFS